MLVICASNVGFGYRWLRFETTAHQRLNLGKISRYFTTAVKITGEMGEISESK